MLDPARKTLLGLTEVEVLVDKDFEATAVNELRHP